MPENFELMLTLWAVMALAVAALAVYRKILTNHEDDTLHVREVDSGTVAQQNVVANKVTVVDRWGKILTGVAFLYGRALAGMWGYADWVARNAG
jgi:hypothetical protein